MYIITSQVIPRPVRHSHHHGSNSVRRGGRWGRWHSSRHHFGFLFHPYPAFTSVSCGRNRECHQSIDLEQHNETDSAAEAVTRGSHCTPMNVETTIPRGQDTPNTNGGDTPGTAPDSSSTPNPTANVKPAPSSTGASEDASKPLSAATTRPIQRHSSNNRNSKDGDQKTIMENTPAHRTETREMAEISLDVSGFRDHQLNIRLELVHLGTVSSGTTPPLRRSPVLTITGERINTLGDRHVIRRRFLLERENLPDDFTTIPIQARISQDSILTVTVPKKQKKPEEESQSFSRTIPITMMDGDTDVVDTKEPEERESNVESEEAADKSEKELTYEIVTVEENRDDLDMEDKKPAAI